MKSTPDVLAARLLAWYREDHRPLPWRLTRDPYRIWVSEIMLQQTRVEAVIPHYKTFLRRYPTLASLAQASEEDVLATWAGLGYYRRARMLHDASKRVVSDRGGEWPRSYSQMRALPGVGDYTAAAVASIAFDEPRPALDGNALRVLSRMADERRDIGTSATRRALGGVAKDLMDAVPRGSRGDFTQALIELGAVVCVPRAPRCERCPWNVACSGLAAGSAPHLPVKGARSVPRRVNLSVALAVRDELVLMRQRPSDASVMPRFWELPMATGDASALHPLGFPSCVEGEELGSFAHSITNTRYTVRVHLAEFEGGLTPDQRWVSMREIPGLPLSTISLKALRLARESGVSAA
ncbi:MAG: A/G-specific adenine glycosylase [Bryobacterales bacterium]|nr:A/G-specific adenine glycosylase [Bryobacterales bacterium]MDE0621808.1 A/G-specific adenine glycosylase [Bryobacterales bacterium]